MEIFKIGWKRIDWETAHEEMDTYFFAFSKEKELLYIGNSFDQRVGDQIQLALERLEVETKGIDLWLGYPDSAQSTYFKINEPLVRDARCLLVHTHEPRYNTRCKDGYTGRDPFKVKSEGSMLFRPCVKVENILVYKIC